MELTDVNYFLLKEQKLSRAKIAEEFNIPEWKLKKLIALNGWGKPPRTIGNESAFAEFNEYSCYWGGFLAADGNVDSKGRVRLTLNYDDTSHVEKLRNFLQSTHKVWSNTEGYYKSSLELTSRVICKDLKENFFIVPNKTDCLEFPWHLPENLLRHYIRGLFDGDGSVCESFSNTNSVTASLYATFCSGSTQYAKDLFEVLNIQLGLKGGLQEYPGKWQLKYNVNDAKTLLTWMYKDASVYLDRKYFKYVDIVVKNNRMTR